MKRELQELLKNSYAPYSNKKFACIVETDTGNFYKGVNIENASFGGSICAERNAINSAISNGERNFKSVYLMNDSDEFYYPCNLCKQTFLEFLDSNVIFNVMNKNGEMKVLTFDQILTKNFSKGQM